MRKPRLLPPSRKVELLQVIANADAGAVPGMLDWRWCRSLAQKMRQVAKDNGWENEPLPPPRS